MVREVRTWLAVGLVVLALGAGSYALTVALSAPGDRSIGEPVVVTPAGTSPSTDPTPSPTTTGTPSPTPTSTSGAPRTPAPVDLPTPSGPGRRR
ncbi:MAG: hypothetical protein NVV66_07980 [Cellulomonas sp.]|uniref:hypothetical protein n=1 Tax=Cellulomonas sp. TaxID=40001 RepID=UPI00258A6782|nr:hypothetical protein [Cellulomonas sp.]MCR6704625.1 hypothetical protein [Cellulomonas sp.]